MAHRLPSLPGRFACLIGLLSGLLQLAAQAAPPAGTAAPPAYTEAVRPVAFSESVAAPAVVPPALAIGVSPPAEFIRQARQRLATHRTISAKVRQRIDLLGEQLAGSGSYEQGPPERHTLRFSLKIQAGENVSTIEQVCDGRTIWLRRALPLSPPSVTRVSVRKLLQAQENVARGGAPHPAAAADPIAGANPAAGADAQGQPGAGAAAAEAAPLASGLGMTLGGLDGTLAGLERVLDFTGAVEHRLGELPTFAIRGEWKHEKLAALFPDQAERLKQGQPFDRTRLPGVLPDQVLIYLGQEDLFPYRLEFRRVTPPDPKGLLVGRPEGDTRPLAVLEFFDVQFDLPLDESLFVFNPGDLDVVDETELYIRRVAVP